jgi:hypothetical protein
MNRDNGVIMTYAKQISLICLAAGALSLLAACPSTPAAERDCGPCQHHAEQALLANALVEEVKRQMEASLTAAVVENPMCTAAQLDEALAQAAWARSQAQAASKRARRARRQARAAALVARQWQNGEQNTDGALQTIAELRTANEALEQSLAEARQQLAMLQARPHNGRSAKLD